MKRNSYEPDDVPVDGLHVHHTAGKEKLYPELWLDTPELQKKIGRFKEKAKGLPQI